MSWCNCSKVSEVLAGAHVFKCKSQYVSMLGSCKSIYRKKARSNAKPTQNVLHSADWKRHFPCMTANAKMLLKAPTSFNQSRGLSFRQVLKHGVPGPCSVEGGRVGLPSQKDSEAMTNFSSLASIQMWSEIQTLSISFGHHEFEGRPSESVNILVNIRVPRITVLVISSIHET